MHDRNGLNSQSLKENTFILGFPPTSFHSFLQKMQTLQRTGENIKLYIWAAHKKFYRSYTKFIKNNFGLYPLCQIDLLTNKRWKKRAKTLY